MHNMPIQAQAGGLNAERQLKTTLHTLQAVARGSSQPAFLRELSIEHDKNENIRVLILSIGVCMCWVET